MLNISSFLQKTRSFFTKEKTQELTLEDPVNKFALELLCQIFSYLPLKDFIRASEVSKNWQAFINNNIHDYRFKPLCLCPKSELVSWKTHFLQLENFKRRVATQNPQPLYLENKYTTYSSAYSSNYHALICDQINGIACIIINKYINFCSCDNGPKTKCYEFQIWNLKNDKLIKTIRSTVGELEDMAFGYPYLLTKANKKVFVRDVSSDSDEPIHTITTLKYAKDLSINKFGFVCSHIKYGSNRTIYTDLIFYQIKKDSLGFYVLGDCGFDFAVRWECEEMFPISFLTDNNLIYETLPGILTVRDVSKQDLPILVNELCSPEIMEEYNLRKENRNHFSNSVSIEIFSRNKITSMVAHDKILVTLSRKDLLIWNLESAQVIKKFSEPSIWRLDAMAGHALFVHHTYSTFHVLNISGEACMTLKEWNMSIDNYRFGCIGYYQEKFYILEQNMEGNRLTRIDYSNK